MPESISTAPDAAVRIETFLDLVAPKLQLVEEELRTQFRSPIRTIDDVGRHILLGGGKRLRPTLLLLVAEMLGYEGTRDINYAAVVEFIHTATLVHDDIIDEAEVRRGRTSINYGWGNYLTVLVGDYLYAHAMDMALAQGDLEILGLLVTATIKMTEGEILGYEQTGRSDVTVDEYFGIVRRKTGALFGAACRIPAHLTKQPPETAEALAAYGFNLGISFQLIDDLLDFTSSTEVLGKPALSDLKEGKMTLPLILAMPMASDIERHLIQRVVSEQSFGSAQPADMIAIVDKYKTVDRTRSLAQEYADRARSVLKGFPRSTAREALEFALDFVMQRVK